MARLLDCRSHRQLENQIWGRGTRVGGLSRRRRLRAVVGIMIDIDDDLRGLARKKRSFSLSTRRAVLLRAARLLARNSTSVILRPSERLRSRTHGSQVAHPAGPYDLPIGLHGLMAALQHCNASTRTAGWPRCHRRGPRTIPTNAADGSPRRGGSSQW